MTTALANHQMALFLDKRNGLRPTIELEIISLDAITHDSIRIT
jgi:hypothetical protein